MCDYWVSKMEFVYALWESAGSTETYQFARAEVAAFEEPVAFSELATGAAGQLGVRIGELRDLGPAGVGGP